MQALFLFLRKICNLYYGKNIRSLAGKHLGNQGTWVRIPSEYIFFLFSFATYFFFIFCKETRKLVNERRYLCGVYGTGIGSGDGSRKGLW